MGPPTELAASPCACKTVLPWSTCKSLIIIWRPSMAKLSLSRSNASAYAPVARDMQHRMSDGRRPGDA